MDQNAYFELGVKLALQQAGFSKDAGVIRDVLSGVGRLFKKKPPKKGSFKAFQQSGKTKRELAQGSATETSAYRKHMGSIKRKQRTG